MTTSDGSTDQRDQFIGLYESRYGKWPGKDVNEHGQADWWKLIDGPRMSAAGVPDVMAWVQEHWEGRGRPLVPIFWRALDTLRPRAPREAGPVERCEMCGGSGWLEYVGSWTGHPGIYVAGIRPGMPASWVTTPCRCSKGEAIAQRGNYSDVHRQAAFEWVRDAREGAERAQKPAVDITRVLAFVSGAGVSDSMAEQYRVAIADAPMSVREYGDRLIDAATVAPEPEATEEIPF